MKNNLISFIIAAFIVGILVEFFVPSPNADSLAILFAKEKEKQPSWYFGEGLKQGDSFRYKICDYILIIPASPDSCYTITLQVVAFLPSPQGNTWIISAHVDHRVRNVDFILQVSGSSFKITTDGSNISYADSLERTLEWVMNFASNHKPQPLVIGKSWGVVASDTIPETHLTVMQIDSVQMEKEIIPTYKIEYSLIKDSFLQIKDDFPIPIKAVIYKPVSVFNDVPLAMTFELLDYFNGENTCVSKTNIVTIPTYQKSLPNSEQKTDLVVNAKLENNTTKNTEEYAQLLKSDNNANIDNYDSTNAENYHDFSNINNTDVETESFDESNFRDKLKNSTTAQVLKELYGPDYEKVITSFDKFIELLTNTTNTIVENQINSTQYEKRD